MDKYTQEEKDVFIAEAKGHVQAMNTSLLSLEKFPGKKDAIRSMLHACHTLKSISSMMTYHQMGGLCHAIEDVMTGIKMKKLKVAECSDTLFQCLDAVSSSLREISEGRPERDTKSLLKRLAALEGGGGDAVVEADGEVPQVEKITSIHVKVQRLDQLMNLSEEILIHKLALDRLKEEIGHPDLTANVDTLGRLITDMQYHVMQARLVPMSSVFDKFPRLVRDLAKQQKKEVGLVIEGADIELDRSVIDEIGDSLVHIVRNAVDHGIESPEERRRASKPVAGTIRIIAKRTRGVAIIEVADDGRGLDIEGITRKAMKQGILSASPSRDAMRDAVFSGISTAKRVTDISGRGLGLNIVKSKIESLGGAVRMESPGGSGTRCILEIPLTLAVIYALFVNVGASAYAIPVDAIERLVTVRQDEIKGMLNAEAIILEHEDVPVIRLDLLFGEPPLPQEKYSIVIVRRGEDRAGLLVNGVMSTQEIVIKPMHKLVRDKRYARSFAATAIIGTGEAILVMDVANLLMYSTEGR